MDRTLESVHRPANRKRYSAVACMRGRLSTGDLLILDAADGSVLHRFDTGAPNNGGNATYTVDGKQYIALMSGNTSPLWPTPPAEGQVIIFGLPD